MDYFYKLLVILSGALLFVLNLLKIAKKKMDIGIGSWWAITALIVVVFGVVFNFASLLPLVRPRNLILIYLLTVAVVMTLYLYGLYVSRLKKELDELSLWVSYAKSVRDAQGKETAECGVRSRSGEAPR
jgi:hypothetical protein